ncbi:MAG: hypothetical protein GY696_27725, partial [Gammaproteobacteria bacterium]|nr:hypothetical protein [Gammaproteobacteria bacterium]
MDKEGEEASCIFLRGNDGEVYNLKADTGCKMVLRIMSEVQGAKTVSLHDTGAGVSLLNRDYFFNHIAKKGKFRASKLVKKYYGSFPISASNEPIPISEQVTLQVCIGKTARQVTFLLATELSLPCLLGRNAID